MIETLAEAAASQQAAFRQQVGQVSRHSSVFFAGTIFTAGVSYLFKIYVARVLGADGLGIFALGMTIVGLIGVFNGLGLPQAATRFVSAYSATAQWARLHVFLRQMSIVLVAANAALAAMILLGGPFLAERVYHAPALEQYLPLFAALLAIGGLTSFCGQILAGYKDVAIRTVVTNFIATPLNILLGVVLLSAGWQLRGYLVAQVATSVIVLVLLVVIAWRLTPQQAREKPLVSVRLEKEVLWFSSAALGVSLLEFCLAQTDKILLGIYLSVHEVGIYAVAATMVAFVPIVLQSVNQIFSPMIADLHSRGEHFLLGRLFQTLTKWILGFTIPLAGVMIVFSRPIMSLFGPAFGVGWAVLVIGTMGQLINAGTGSVGYLLFMSGNQKRLIRVQAVSTVFVLTVTVILVQRFGMLGVATAAALTNVVTNCLYLREVGRVLELTPYNRTYVRLIFPSVASVLVALALRFATVNAIRPSVWIVVTLMASYAVFMSLALAVGLDDDDRMIVLAIRARLGRKIGNLSFSK